MNYIPKPKHPKFPWEWKVADPSIFGCPDANMHLVDEEGHSLCGQCTAPHNWWEGYRSMYSTIDRVSGKTKVVYPVCPFCVSKGMAYLWGRIVGGTKE